MGKLGSYIIGLLFLSIWGTSNMSACEDVRSSELNDKLLLERC